jgi:hypothetical protein
MLLGALIEAANSVATLEDKAAALAGAKESMAVILRALRP